MLTLPALKALRDAYSRCQIEILGYPHIAAVADKRFYADAVRSIEYGALSSFFARHAEISLDLRDYFGGFDLILSYLYDPDQIFRQFTSVRRAKNRMRSRPNCPGIARSTAIGQALATAWNQRQRL